jgi:hypothetical protein
MLFFFPGVMDPHPRKAFWRTLPHWDPLVMLQSWAIHPPWEAQSKIGIFIDLDAFWALRTMERPTATEYNYIITGYNWIYI